MATFPYARPLARTLSVFVVTVLAACKGLTSIDASFQNITRVDTVYALNSGPAGSPNAFKFFDNFKSRSDQGFSFDIAFDLDPSGNVVIIPAKAMATNFSNPYSVGLQRVTAPFETVLEAPKDGYRPDTSMVVGLNQAFVVESRDSFGVCLYALKGQSYYSKVSVTDVDTGLRRIIFTTTINRNCGFRSFAPGIPRD